MRKRIRKIFAISLILSMILPAVLASYTSAVSEAQKPSYSIGDYWKYNIKYFDSGMNGTTTKKIVGESNITLDNRLYDCFVIEKVQMMENWTYAWKIYIEKTNPTNLTIVKEDYQISFNGEPSLIMNTTYSPPLNELDFPITEGKSWITEGMKHVTTTIPPFPPFPPKIVPFSQNFSVVRTERVNVPAGGFDTFVIEHSYLDGKYEEYYSPIASGNVRESYYNRDGKEIMRMELLESNYVISSGLEWWVWLAIAIIVIASIAFIFFIRRRKKPSPVEMPAVTPSPA
ncbi:MAG: hypothetical protein H3Z53_08775 [archaeon]|nr:hypothetical protein [archaeon]